MNKTEKILWSVIIVDIVAAFVTIIATDPTKTSINIVSVCASIVALCVATLILKYLWQEN